MKRYAVKYTRIPTNYNPSANAVVEAESPEAALELLRHQLGDFNGVYNHVLGTPVEYVPPASKGRIVTMNYQEGRDDA
jgi:hypothetical protein